MARTPARPGGRAGVLALSRTGRAVVAGPARCCPACYAPNAWSAERCERCGGALWAPGTFDERLIWALDHRDTATAMLAAAILALRHVVAAVPALLRLVDSPDPYRALAAAQTLSAFCDDPRVAGERDRLRTHASAMVRGAFSCPPDGERPAAGRARPPGAPGFRRGHHRPSAGSGPRVRRAPPAGERYRRGSRLAGQSRPGCPDARPAGHRRDSRRRE